MSASSCVMGMTSGTPPAATTASRNMSVAYSLALVRGPFPGVQHGVMQMMGRLPPLPVATARPSRSAASARRRVSASAAQFFSPVSGISRTQPSMESRERPARTS